MRTALLWPLFLGLLLVQLGCEGDSPPAKGGRAAAPTAPVPAAPSPSAPAPPPPPPPPPPLTPSGKPSPPVNPNPNRPAAGEPIPALDIGALKSPKLEDRQAGGRVQNIAVAQPGPGKAAPPPVVAKPRVESYLQQAKTAFAAGREAEGIAWLLAEAALRGDQQDDVVQTLRWCPKLKRPMFAARWGILFHDAEKAKAEGGENAGGGHAAAPKTTPPVAAAPRAGKPMAIPREDAHPRPWATNPNLAGFGGTTLAQGRSYRARDNLGRIGQGGPIPRQPTIIPPGGFPPGGFPRGGISPNIDPATGRPWAAQRGGNVPRDKAAAPGNTNALQNLSEAATYWNTVVGQPLIEQLEKRVAKGDYGQWLKPAKGEDAEADAEAMKGPSPGIVLIADGPAAQVQQTIQEERIVLLVVAEITVKPATGRAGPLSVLTLHVKDPATDKDLLSPKPPINSGLMALHKGTTGGPANQLVRQITTFADQNLRLAEMPAITHDVALKRAAALAESQPADPLPALAELRYYQWKELLSPEEVTEYYGKLLGEEDGRRLASGSMPQRREVVERLLKP